MDREDPLYQGMTRDAMVLGVTLDCFILEVIVWSIAFLVTRSIWGNRFSLTGKGSNKGLWGGTSYDPD
jgi:type IV secretory pathway VirB3-like protein